MLLSDDVAFPMPAAEKSEVLTNFESHRMENQERDNTKVAMSLRHGLKLMVFYPISHR